MYLEISIKAPPEWEEPISSLLMEHGVKGTWAKESLIFKNRLIDITGYIDLDFKDPQTEKERILKIINILENNIGFPLQTRIKVIENKPWEDLWKDKWKPFRIKNLVIIPAWKEASLKKDDIPIRIDPGRGFGTGLHPSTRQVLWFLTNLAETNYIKDKTVLDIGTGSGILAICAAKLGARRVIAFDIDLPSLMDAKRNTFRNAVQEKIFLFQGKPGMLKEKFDLVLANLETDILLKYAESIAETVKNGGYLAVAGINIKRANEVETKYCGLEMNKAAQLARGRWAAFLFFNKKNQ